MRLLIVLSFFNYSIICNAQSDTIRIREHLVSIVKTENFRNFMNPGTLDSVASYIHYVFSLYADSIYYQDYLVNGTRYRNVIASFGVRHQETIVIGAHYDVCGQQDGADDNASGIVGLLELARQIKTDKLSKRIDLVAYTLEEPPYFRTENMGSYRHAAMLDEEKRDVCGMISLEMIAYFKTERKTQDYPIGLLKLFYGSRGDYITLVNKFGKGRFAKKFTRKYKRGSGIKTKRFIGPKKLTGIDFSDHLNYWRFGYSALMITDTAFYRNKNYHEKTDTIETLDLESMAKVIDGVLLTLHAIQ